MIINDVRSFAQSLKKTQMAFAYADATSDLAYIEW